MKAFIQSRTSIKLRGICHGNQFGKRNEQRKMKWKKTGTSKRGSRFLYHQLFQPASSASESEESSPLPPEGERMHSPLMYMPPWASQAARACSSSSCFCIASSYPGQDGSEVGSASHFASKSSSSLEEEEPLLGLVRLSSPVIRLSSVL